MSDLPANTVRYLASRGYRAVPITRHDDVPLPPGTYQIVPLSTPAPPFMFAGCVIDCDTHFPETPE